MGQNGNNGYDWCVYMTELDHKAKDVSNRMLAQAAREDALDQKSDEVLITLFQAGDREVFRLLVERYQERVRNLVASIFQQRDLIDDLTQEVFIRVFEALPHFRFESSFPTWLYRIAVNRSRDEIRKRKVRRFFSLHMVDETKEEAVRDRMMVEPADSEAREIVARGLSAIPEKFRLPVILKDLDGLSYQEIAEVLQCEIGTVKSRLSRGRSMLRAVLRPLLEEQ
ncbi:MAG: sigma-70 family RNA polymerase sigma factor [Ignavibacteriales bacterium]|nr:sigma-70 family RNA polymerase sigma factor [Ignavibacteriales bacterium]